MILRSQLIYACVRRTIVIGMLLTIGFVAGCRTVGTAVTGSLRLVGDVVGQLEKDVETALGQQESTAEGNQSSDELQDQNSAVADGRALPQDTNPISGMWALVVGLSDYKYEGSGGLSPLAYANEDAEAFTETLIDLGWNRSHIRMLLDEQATQRDIAIGIDSWLSKAGPDDVVVLYWSGHAFPDPKDQEKVYFACYDTDPRIPATGHRMDRVRDALEELRVRNVIVFADTCHAGKLVTRGDEKAIGLMPYVTSIAEKHDIPKGWIFMVGSESHRKAIEDSSWSHGAFTYCLLKGLKGSADGFESIGTDDGIVTMGELRAYLERAMPDETQKVLGVARRPLITANTGDPSIWDLSLVEKKLNSE